MKQADNPTVGELLKQLSPDAQADSLAVLEAIEDHHRDVLRGMGASPFLHTIHLRYPNLDDTGLSFEVILTKLKPQTFFWEIAEFDPDAPEDSVDPEWFAECAYEDINDALDDAQGRAWTLAHPVTPLTEA